MKILITNDDGIEAGGIIKLAENAKKFGEVTV
ncbi:MAG: 5'/3'-nucleotidase SurE, partial [Lachnospiraceae bacterium]